MQPVACQSEDAEEQPQRDGGAGLGPPAEEQRRGTYARLRTTPLRAVHKTFCKRTNIDMTEDCRGKRFVTAGSVRQFEASQAKEAADSVSSDKRLVNSTRLSANQAGQNWENFGGCGNRRSPQRCGMRR